MDGQRWHLGPSRRRARTATRVQSKRALRESFEEAGIRPAAARVFDEFVDDHGGWRYTTVLADLVAQVDLIAQAESQELRWVQACAIEELPLHPGFAPDLATAASACQIPPMRSTRSPRPGGARQPFQLASAMTKVFSTGRGVEPL